MHIYSLLIMSGNIMGWAFDWAANGPGPSLGPTVLLLWAPRSWLVVFRFIKFSFDFLKLAT